MARKKPKRKSPIYIGTKRGKGKRKAARANKILKREHERTNRIIERLRSIGDDTKLNRELKKLYRKYSAKWAKTVEDKIRALREFAAESERASKWINNYVKKGWSRKKARSMYYIVTDDIYQQFRQKFNPPSDLYFQLIDEGFDENEILQGMQKLVENDDITLDDVKDTEALFDILRNVIATL